jgi:hypothetical protein
MLVSPSGLAKVARRKIIGLWIEAGHGSRRMAIWQFKAEHILADKA